MPRRLLMLRPPLPHRLPAGARWQAPCDWREPPPRQRKALSAGLSLVEPAPAPWPSALKGRLWCSCCGLRVLLIQPLGELAGVLPAVAVGIIVRRQKLLPAGLYPEHVFVVRAAAGGAHPCEIPRVHGHILTTSTGMPVCASKCRRFHLERGVSVAFPARAASLAALLRAVRTFSRWSRHARHFRAHPPRA